PMANDGCLFCRIASKELPSDRLFEDDQVVAFRDMRPQAPVHFLVIPKKHIESMAKTVDADQGLLGHILRVGASLAEKQEVFKDGYRMVINTGVGGGQTVLHLHLHVIGGRPFSWPPG